VVSPEPVQLITSERSPIDTEVGASAGALGEAEVEAGADALEDPVRGESTPLGVVVEASSPPQAVTDRERTTATVASTNVWECPARKRHRGAAGAGVAADVDMKLDMISSWGGDRMQGRAKAGVGERQPARVV
jgi:hypothetical protein